MAQGTRHGDANAEPRKAEQSVASEVRTNTLRPANTNANGQATPAHKLGPIYTMVARQGVNSADIINGALAKKTLGRNPVRRLQIAAPDGPSTAGGKHARQPIRLVEEGSAVGGLMCGYLDAVRKVAELRDYGLLAKQHRERFGTIFEPTAQEYDALIENVEGMLKSLGFEVTREHATETAVWTPQGELPELTRSGLIWLAAATVSVGVLIALLW